MKLIGIVMICMASSILGYIQGEKYKDHYNEQIYLKKLVMLIRGEIRYNCGVLSEVFGNVARKAKKPYSDIFMKLSEELAKANGIAFGEIWKREVIDRLSATKLWESDITGFQELGENMGYLDMQMQLNYIDFYIDKLTEEINNTQEKLQGNVKLFKSLGIMGGLLLAILLI